MADVQATGFLPVAALKATKLPPLVHPQTLASAAALCAEFGGSREALNAAALAAAILQARMLNAQKSQPVGGPAPVSAGSLGGTVVLRPPPHPVVAPVPPGLPALPSSSVPGPPPGVAAVAVESASPELREQAKQAMAAAQATNRREPQQPRPQPHDPFTPQQATERLAAAAAVPMPLAPTGLALGPPGPILPHPMIMGMPPAAVVRPPQVRPAPQQAAPVREPPKAAKPAAAAAAAKAEAPPPKEEKPLEAEGAAVEKRRVEEKRPAVDEAEPVRCHLHRKPQLNCKICRRIYYSALDPNTQKKEERNKDKLASERARRNEDEPPGARRRGPEAFEITNKQTFNFNSMLRDQILKNTYFKSLMNVETFEGIVDELYQYAETAEVYGAGTTTVPSTLFCCLFRLFTIGISYDELQQLLETRDWPFIRCCGFLYIRFGCAAEKLWDQLGDYCLDDQEFEPSKGGPSFAITIGEYVEALLMDERYYYTALPRIPVAVKRKMEERVAPLPQYRRRTMANKKVLHLFREPGTPVEACSNGDWVEGTVVQLVDTFPTRILVRVRLENGNEETQHLGKVILLDGQRGPRPAGVRGRSRSRSPRRAHSPDWTRSRGKSQEEMVQELRARQRERAVCSSGKEYARKPIGFMSGLALKRDVGVASTRLREEETYAPRQVEHRKQMTEEEEMERRKEERDRFQDRETQLRMQQLFEKYGANQPHKVAKEKETLDATLEGEPEVLRLG